MKDHEEKIYCSHSRQEVETNFVDTEKGPLIKFINCYSLVEDWMCEELEKKCEIVYEYGEHLQNLHYFLTKKKIIK